MSGYYFPKNKDAKNPTDLLDRPIQEGDYVVWPTSAGRAVGISVGVIEKINFKSGDGKCPQHAATSYTVRVKPLKAGAKYHYTRQEEYVPAGFLGKDGKRHYFRDIGAGVKPVTVQKVNNIVKLETPTQVEDDYAEPRHG